MDEAFRLPVRAWRIGSRVEVTQPETCATLLEHARAVSPAVVGHHPGDVDAEVAEVGDGGAEEDGDGGAGLVRIDLGEADAGVVVDADVHVVPASPGRALAAVPGDAVAGLLEAREFLDVEVEQLTGVLPLVAPDRRGRREGVEPVKPCPPQDPTDGGGRHPHGPRNLDPRLALEAQRRDAGDDTNRRGPGLSSRPRTAIAEARWAFGLIPGDPLAHRARTDARGSRDEAYCRWSSSTGATSSARLAGVVLAF